MTANLVGLSDHPSIGLPGGPAWESRKLGPAANTPAGSRISM